MLIEAHDDPHFSSVLEQADLVVTDGKPLAIALHLLHGINQERVSGMDMMPALIAEAVMQKIPIFFYGSTDSVLERVVRRAKAEHPSISIAGTYSPPFRRLTPTEDVAEFKLINESDAGIVFVALGCPKQELWMARNKGKINAVMVGIGGALPVYAGLQKRAPKWMQRYALEWLFRLCQEPRRLFRRYLITNSKFLFLVFREIVLKSFNRSPKS